MAEIDVLLQGFSLNTNQGSIAFCGVTLIRGSRNILVDVAHSGRRTLLLDALRARGMTPADIDAVFLTHAHWDHMLNIDLFPNARVLMHPREREYIRDPHPDDWATHRYASLVLETHRVEEVVEGQELDDGVSPLATPGHSRGSMSLIVRQADSTAAICGDAMPNSAAFHTGTAPLVFWDGEAARNSVARLLETASVFYPGHDRPFAVDGPRHTYIQPTSIQLYGWPVADGNEGSVIGYTHELRGGETIHEPPPGYPRD